MTVALGLHRQSQPTLDVHRVREGRPRSRRDTAFCKSTTSVIQLLHRDSPRFVRVRILELDSQVGAINSDTEASLNLNNGLEQMGCRSVVADEALQASGRNSADLHGRYHLGHASHCRVAHSDVGKHFETHAPVLGDEDHGLRQSNFVSEPADLALFPFLSGHLKGEFSLATRRPKRDDNRSKSCCPSNPVSDRPERPRATKAGVRCRRHGQRHDRHCPPEVSPFPRHSSAISQPLASGTFQPTREAA